MIILDVEIKKAILGRNDIPILGIEYCDGWRDFAGMGISCVCTYDIKTHLTRVFLEEDLIELAEYLQGKYTAGFNTRRFDLPLLEANGVQPCWLEPDTHYDILEEIWIALGLNPNKFNPRTHGGWGLDAVCQATLGIAKTGHGALAPVWWQQGRRGRVIDYCCNDGWMEGSLLLHIIQKGVVSNGKEKVAVSPPRLPVDQLLELGQGETVIGRQYGAAQAKVFETAGSYEGPHMQSGETTVGGLGFKERYPACTHPVERIHRGEAWDTCTACGTKLPAKGSTGGLGIVR